MREFAKIKIALWRSKKFRAISSAETRLVYLYLHTSASSNVLGCYHITPACIAHHTYIPAVRVGMALEELHHQGLIEWEGGAQFVRIVDFLRHSACASKKHAMLALRTLFTVEVPNMVAALVHELAGDMQVHALGKLGRAKLREAVEEAGGLDWSTFDLPELPADTIKERKPKAPKAKAEPVEDVTAEDEEAVIEADAEPVLEPEADPEPAAPEPEAEPAPASKGELVAAPAGQAVAVRASTGSALLPSEANHLKQVTLTEAIRVGRFPSTTETLKALAVRVIEKHNGSTAKVADETEKFLHYWTVEKRGGKKVDWIRTYLNWMDTAASRGMLRKSKEELAATTGQNDYAKLHERISRVGRSWANWHGGYEDEKFAALPGPNHGSGDEAQGTAPRRAADEFRDRIAKACNR